MSQIQPIFVSVVEAAQMLGLTPWEVYQLLDDRKIKAQYNDNRRLVRVDSILEYADSLPVTLTREVSA